MSAAAERAVQGEEAAIIARKRAIVVRFFHYCRPKTPEGWSLWLTGLVVLLVPFWFWAANQWNPNYTPYRAWVWSVPWIICFAYFIAKLQFVLKSAVEHTERIGLKEMFVSLTALASVLITTAVLVVLWALGHYYLGGFQVHLIIAFIVATGAELLMTATIRFVINKRYFGNVGSDA